jgi:hypothetical protein
VFRVSDSAIIAAKSAMQTTDHRNENVIEEECEIKIQWPFFFNILKEYRLIVMSLFYWLSTGSCVDAKGENFSFDTSPCPFICPRLPPNEGQTSGRITFIVAPCISMIQLFSHTNLCTYVIYY